jgi:hypothetical protein
VPTGTKENALRVVLYIYMPGLEENQEKLQGVAHKLFADHRPDNWFLVGLRSRNVLSRFGVCRRPRGDYGDIIAGLFRLEYTGFCSSLSPGVELPEPTSDGRVSLTSDLDGISSDP